MTFAAIGALRVNFIFQMENIEQCPDKGSPSDPTSLVELCCRTVAKQFCVYDKTDILGNSRIFIASEKSKLVKIN